VSWIADIRRRLAAHNPRIGPGRLVLVVGPSGAGKDTLITLARGLCRGKADIVFPRRIITRPSSSAEDHDTVSEAEFERVVAANGFALWWRAHGLCYALSRSIDGDIRAGRTIVSNVSRTMIEQARNRYARVSAVLITAPAEVLAGRLAQRGREEIDAVAARLGRAAASESTLQPDFVIENVGSPESGAKLLRDIIYGRDFTMGC
jgi:ribose 1,5-bisphosphokinase